MLHEPAVLEPSRLDGPQLSFTAEDLLVAEQLLARLDGDCLAALDCVRMAAAREQAVDQQG